MSNTQTIELNTAMKNSVILKEFKPFEESLAEFKESYTGIVYDFSDKKSEKQARSDKYKIGQVISNLDKKHKELKTPLVEELNEKIGLLDGKRKEVKTELLSLQDDIKKQIEQHEKEIAENAAEVERKMGLFEAWATIEQGTILTSEQIEIRLKQVRHYQVDDSFGERKGEAAIAKDETIQKLESHYEDATQREFLEKIEREEFEKKEAEHFAQMKIKMAEDAKIQAEAAAQQAIKDAEIRALQAEAKVSQDRTAREQEALQAAKRAEERAIAAEQNAKDSAAREAARIEAKTIRDAEAAEAEKKAREKNKDNKARIDKEIIEDLVKFKINPVVASAIVSIIAKKFIRHITINY